jgi:hypothetical protein
LLDESDRPAEPGVYFARFSGDAGTSTRRFVIAR